MTTRLNRIAEIGTGVIGLAMLSTIILRPNAAKIIEESGKGFKSMIAVAVVQRHIEERSPEALDKLFALADTEQLDLYTSLSDGDLDWLVDMLTIND